MTTVRLFREGDGCANTCGIIVLTACVGELASRSWAPRLLQLPALGQAARPPPRRGTATPPRGHGLLLTIDSLVGAELGAGCRQSSGDHSV